MLKLFIQVVRAHKLDLNVDIYFSSMIGLCALVGEWTLVNKIHSTDGFESWIDDQDAVF